MSLVGVIVGPVADLPLTISSLSLLLKSSGGKGDESVVSEVSMPGGDVVCIGSSRASNPKGTVNGGNLYQESIFFWMILPTLGRESRVRVG